MSILVNVGAGAKAVAPQISAETLEKPGAFEAAYKQWRQYELNKGSDACSFQQCFAENLLRVLVKRKGVKFGAAEQGDKESDEQFSARRKKEAADAAEKIFSILAPKNTVDEQEFILKSCTFKYGNKKGPLSLQISMHEVKFGDAVEQCGKTLTEPKKVKAYILCFNEEMQKELKFVGQATGDEAAFTTWQQYADWITTAAENIDKAEAQRALFGMPGTRAALAKKITAESEPQPEDQPAPAPAAREPKKPCYRCGEFGHFARYCPYPDDELKHRKAVEPAGKEKPGYFAMSPSRELPAGRKPLPAQERPDSRELRRSPRLAERSTADRSQGTSQPRYAASAHVRRKLKTKINRFYNTHAAKSNTRVTAKDLNELLDTGDSDPNTDSLSDSDGECLPVCGHD